MRFILQKDEEKPNTIKEVTHQDRFKPKLYNTLYIPSWVNGYSIGLEFIYNWFLSRFPDKYFRTIHILGKHPFDDFRRFEYGEYVKREKPAVSIGSSIQYDFDDNNLDIHLFGIDGYMRRSNLQRSFFKDMINKLYVSFTAEVMQLTFNFRCRFETRAEQLDAYKRIEIMFRFGCTETIEADMDFHIPYELMCDLAQDAGFDVEAQKPLGEKITDPYGFLSYLNSHSQIPVLYKLRYINDKHEYFIRMRNMPIHLDMRNKPDADEGEQEGQTSNNFNIEMQFVMRLPVPKFYVYYNELHPEQKTVVQPSNGINIYSMRVLDIPDVNSKGWTQFATSNYLKDENEKLVQSIDITSLFDAPVNGANRDVSLQTLINDAIKVGISPSMFIDIKVFTNDLQTDKGLLLTNMDWEHNKILLPKNTFNSYFYISIYLDQKYVNDMMIDKQRMYRSRVKILPHLPDRKELKLSDRITIEGTDAHRVDVE